MLSNHVTTLEQSRKLYELGFRKTSLYVYIDTRKAHKEYNKKLVWREMVFVPFDTYNEDPEIELVYHPWEKYENWYNDSKPIWAYLLSEIMEALPLAIERNGCKLFLEFDGCEDWDRWAGYWQDETETHAWLYDMFILSKTTIEAACDLLIWCIENWFISTK